MADILAHQIVVAHFRVLIMLCQHYSTGRLKDDLLNEGRLKKNLYVSISFEYDKPKG